MNYSKYTNSMKQQLVPLTDDELISLESMSRRDGEVDCANACSAILLQRRNRPILAKDEYIWKVGAVDEDFEDFYK